MEVQIFGGQFFAVPVKGILTFGSKGLFDLKFLLLSQAGLGEGVLHLQFQAFHNRQKIIRFVLFERSDFGLDGLLFGFIGQFGKMMAEAITNKIRLRRVRKQPLSEVDAKPSVLPSPPLAAAVITDKKNLKALAKGTVDLTMQRQYTTVNPANT